jgi:hypothetical protein
MRDVPIQRAISILFSDRARRRALTCAARATGIQGKKAECCLFSTTGKTLPPFRSNAKCPALPAKIFLFPEDRIYDLTKSSRLDTRDVMAIRHQT